MNKEQDILNWIHNVSKVRPELNGFAICPFAAKSKYKIIEADIDNLLPIEGFEVIIYILDDNLTLDEIQGWVDHYNEKYPDWKFFEDCKFYPTYINGVQTNNDQYNLILTQPKEKLRRFREQLAKTGYYKQWNEDYLKEILGDDYDIIESNKTNSI